MDSYMLFLCCFLTLYFVSSGEGAKLDVRSLSSLRVRRTSDKNSNSESESRVSRSRNQDQHCFSKTSSPKSNTIIRSTASIDNGAEFISSISNVSSSDECFNSCCQKPSCDTAIFEEKNNRRCYMFKCQEKCKFKPHEGYSVWDVERRAETPAPLPREEEELAHLPTNGNRGGDDGPDGVNADSVAAGGGSDGQRNDQVSDDNDEDVKNSENPVPAASRSQEAKAPHVAPHTAELSGFCTSDVSCEDPNAGCYKNSCRCKDGFYSKDGLCRKVCPQSQFECLALGTLGRGPECIPQEQKCDSFMQCADGSDEFDCDDPDTQSNSHVPDSVVDDRKEIYHPDVKETALENKHSHDRTITDTTFDKNAVKDASSKVDATKSKPKEPKTPAHDSTVDKSQNKTKPAADKAGKATKHNQTHPPSSNNSPPKPSHISSHSKVFLTQEKVIIASSTSEAEGPIIALSLGLAFTLILMVLFACRLRHMKHRMRKVALNSNEADYLINGMYL